MSRKISYRIARREMNQKKIDDDQQQDENERLNDSLDEKLLIEAGGKDFHTNCIFRFSRVFASLKVETSITERASLASPTSASVRRV